MRQHSLTFSTKTPTITGENHEDGLICHIFLERFPAEYRNVLPAVGPKAPVKKLTITDNRIADVDKAILVAVFYSNMTFSWILTCIVWQTLWRTLSRLVWCIKDFPYPFPWLTRKRIRYFANFKKIANITKLSFYKKTLPHSITHHITTTSPPVLSQLTLKN